MSYTQLAYTHSDISSVLYGFAGLLVIGFWRNPADTASGC